MKKLFQFLASLLVFAIFTFWIGCNKSDKDPTWSDADKSSYENVLKTQDQISDDLDDWFQTMDSLDAINQAYQAFVNSENVSSATINSQGIAVQYSNGMRGGLYLNPKDDKSEVGEALVLGPVINTDENLKSMVNKKELLLIDPHYFERDYYTDQIRSTYTANFNKLGIIRMFIKDQQATVDKFTTLSDYGIIHVYSHGLAWPKQQNITDVYVLTGETANYATSKKYWDELTKGNIPVMKIFHLEDLNLNKYFVSKEFIEDYNDFGNDTILFYGGFCYSFLGNWPDLVDDFADGAYVGFDWSVYTHRNANWAVNCMYYLSDTSLERPMTLQGWFDNTDQDLSYWNEEDSRTVSIHYVGDGNLKLWDDVKVRLIALSSDGTPVSKPGEVGVTYPFRCEVVTNISSLEYIWDIGDGTSPVATQGNEVNITWSEEGNYILSVTVKNKNTNADIGTANLSVTIGESNNNDLIEFLASCTTGACQFGPSGAFTYSPEYNGGPLYVSMNSENLVWSGLSFTGTNSIDNLGSSCSISGSVSSDGQKVSYVAHLEYISEFTNEIWQNFTITVSNLPLTLVDYDGSAVENPSARYGWNYAAENFQPYVTSIEGYEVDGEGTTHTVTGVNWSSTDRLNFGFWKERTNNLNHFL